MTYREADNLPPRRGPPAAPRRRARRKRAESREQILRAATREFVTHGFAGARISRIIGRAGSNPRMLYHYFGSKSQLYVAVLEEALGGLRRQELQIDVEHLDPREGLLAALRFHGLSLRAQPAFGPALVRREFAQSEIYAKIVTYPGNVVSRARYDRTADRTRHRSRDNCRNGSTGCGSMF